MRRAILGALPVLGADQLADFGLHQFLGHRPHRLADHVCVLIARTFLTTSAIVILS
jgi:hypothetical protein